MRALDIGGPPPTGRLEVHPVVINMAASRSSATSNLAPADGTYSRPGSATRFRIRKGGVLPHGAQFTPAPKSEAPTGPEVIDSQRASAALGNGYAEALKAAGFVLYRETDPVEGEVVEIESEGRGEQLADLLRAAGYELVKTSDGPADEADAKPEPEAKPAKKGRTSDGPAENTDAPGPRETT